MKGNNMEELEHQGYRDRLAKDLRDIGDRDERKEVLESEQESAEYKKAKELHLEDVAADPEKFRLARIEELSQESEMVDFLKEVIKEEEKRDKDRPFGERESYYSRSSHSDWDSYSGLRWLPEGRARLLFRLAERDEKWAKVVAELDKYTLMGYVTAATKDEIDYEKNPDRWFHLPFSGAMTTFHDILRNDWRVFPGRGIKDGKDVEGDQRISEVIPEFEKASKLLHEAAMRNRGFFTRYEPQKRAEAVAVLKDVHA